MKEIKKFISTLVIKILPLLILGAFIEYQIRDIPNDYKVKREYMDRNANKIELLFLGDSHIFRGLNPSDFDLRAYNLSQPAQLIEYDCAVFKKYEESMNNLKYLILGIDIRTFFRHIEEIPGMDNSYKYSIYYGIDNHHSGISSYFEILHLRGNLKKILGMFMKKIKGENENLIDIDLNGYSPRFNQKYLITKYFCTKLEDCKCPGNKRAKAHNPISGRKFVDENKKYAEEIISICKKKNVKIILLMTPCYKFYRNHLKWNSLTETRGICTMYEKANDNVYFIDLLDDIDFCWDDYNDVDHLRNNGAHKLSKKVNDFIKQHCN